MFDLFRFIHIIINVKVKQSLYRPRLALSFAWCWGCHISRHLEHEDGRAVFTLQEIFLLLISVRGLFDHKAVVRPEGLRKWKVPLTPSGIETATFCLVAQCLNQLRNHVPPPSPVADKYKWEYKTLCLSKNKKKKKKWKISSTKKPIKN